MAPLYLAPLVATTFLPAFDLPQHLSAVDALTKASDPDSPYARDFIVGLDPQFPCRMRDPRQVPPVPFFTYPERFAAARWLEDLDLLFVRGGPPAEKIFGSEVSKSSARRRAWPVARVCAPVGLRLAHTRRSGACTACAAGQSE